MNSRLSTGFVSTPSARPHRSLVITPLASVSRQAASSVLANFTSASLPSSSPRFVSAPVQAKMVAMGLVEVLSPFR